MIGKSGVVKERGRSGRCRRSTMTPMLTIANAKSVPMLVASASCPSGTKPARMLITTVTMMVLLTGVWVRGLTFSNTLGSRPSRAIANRMRVWPYITVSTTLKIETTAPSEMIAGAHSEPVTSRAMVASTASPPSPANSSQGLAPIAASATRT